MNNNHQNNNKEFECVGSLLLPARDIQELSLSSSPPNADESNKGSPIAVPKTLQVKRRATVGTLLVSPNELQFPVGAGGGGSPIAERLSLSSSNLRKRVTARMNGPAPRDEEADTWAD